VTDPIDLVFGPAGLPRRTGSRAYAVNLILGERPPAFHRELVIAPGGCFEPASTPAGDVVAFRASAAVGARADLELVDHLYLQFSAHPPSMTFDEYSAWYQVHQDENIAQTDGLRRGWRFRLESLAYPPGPAPTHLAAYEIDGPLERVTGDLGRAMDAGLISLPGWFTRFASLEAVAAA
jgi:hypothetical protein